MNEKAPTIAVLGDLALDRYVSGSTTRLSSEAPIPVLNVKTRTTNLACAANTAANIKAMGATPLMVGRIGTGEYGDLFKRQAFRQSIDLSYTVPTKTPMNAKTRLIAQGQQIARFDEETHEALTPAIRKALIASLKKARKQTNIILLSDYGYHTLDAEIIQTVVTLWKDGTILHDPQAFHPQTLTGVHAITPNLKEAKFLLGNTQAKNTDADTAALAAQLIEKYSLQYILFTRSEKGMSLFEADGTASHVPAYAKEVFDVSGAGDTVIAAYATALSKGFSRVEAMHLANIAGSVAVSKRGVQTVSWEEIQQFEKEHVPAV